MKQFNLFAAALLLGVALPEPGTAQLQPADRIRILTVRGISVTGVVTALSPDSIAVRVGIDEPHWIRRGEIAYLERSDKRYRKFARNLAVTTLSGTAIGGMIGALTWTKCVSNQLFGCLMHPESRSGAFVFGGVLAGALSVPAGVLMGLAIKYDHWVPVRGTSDEWSSFSVAPRFGSGLGLSASYSF